MKGATGISYGADPYGGWTYSYTSSQYVNNRTGETKSAADFYNDTPYLRSSEYVDNYKLEIIAHGIGGYTDSEGQFWWNKWRYEWEFVESDELPTSFWIGQQNEVLSFQGNPLIPYNEHLGFVLSTNSIATSIVNSAAVTTSISARGRYMSKAKYLQTTARYAKTAKIIGAYGVGISLLANGYEFVTGTYNTSTFIDIGVTAVGIGAGVIFGVAAAPYIAVGGLAYGVFSIAGESDWINQQWGLKRQIAH